MWSQKLIDTTREQAYPGACMKCSDGQYGIMTKRDASGIEISGIELKNYMPVSTGEIIAKYKNFDEMLNAGWVID